MAVYSMDLRTRVLADWDAGIKAEEVAPKCRVGRAWVHRLVQRWRETGEIGPRRQKKFRARCLDAAQQDRLQHLVIAQPDRTLAELRDAVADDGESRDAVAHCRPDEVNRQKATVHADE